MATQMVETKKASVKPIAAVERALLVLDAFRRGPGTLSFTEIVAATGLLKTTVFRLLHTFQTSGYLIRLPDGRFQLSAVFMQLGTTYRQAFRLEDHIMPALQRLVIQTQESASFYIREGTQRVCLLRVDSQQMVRDVVPAGTVLPIDDTAASLILREYETYKPTETFLEDTNKAIRMTVGKGSTPQIASVSAPVFGLEGLLGAISITGPRERFNPESVTEMKAALQEEASGLSARLLGHRLESG